MFSHGNFFILLILLKCTSFIKFLQAENSTKIIINKDYNDSYIDKRIININSKINKYNNKNITSTLASELVNDKNLYMATLNNNSFDDSREEVLPDLHEIKSPTATDTDSIETRNLFDENDRVKVKHKRIILELPDEGQGSDQADENDDEDDVGELLAPRTETLIAGSRDDGGVVGGVRQKSFPREQQMQRVIPPSVAAATAQNVGDLPVFPERPDAVYFIVAVIGGARSWGRTLARTLLDMGPPFGSPMGPPLRPIYVDLPPNEKFSVKVLTSLCQQSEGVPLAGIVAIGDGQAARAVALSGTAMKVPVLWAKGGTAHIHGIQREAESTLQSMLQPSAKEILEAIRALFLQTHWYSFFVLSDVGATMVLAGSEGVALKELPLVPTVLPLPPGDGDVFKQLAQISRSTRGVVLMLCDLFAARRIMSEAKRLNMAGGHFIWVWADTSSTTEFFDVHPEPDIQNEKIVEYPEAVKQQFTPSEPIVKVDDSFSKHFEDFGEKKINFEDLESVRRRNGVDMKTPQPPPPPPPAPSLDRVKNRQNQHQKEQQQLPPKHVFNREQDSGVGRYIFGLNENSREEIEEIKLTKEKRNRNAFNDAKIASEYTEYSYEDEDDLEDDNDEDADHYSGVSKELKNANGANKRTKSNSFDTLRSDRRKSSTTSYSPYQSFKENQHNEQEQRRYHQRSQNGDDHDDYFDNSSDDIDNNHRNYNVLAVSNETDSNSSRNHKPKRTSVFYGRNLTTSSHVLFHHFKDFPVGLLALRPVRMHIDRHFLRATIRLFASTWSKVEQDAAMEEEMRARYRARNPYSNDNHGWWHRDRDRDRERSRFKDRERSKDNFHRIEEQRITISKTRRRPNNMQDRSDSGIRINTRYRKRRRRELNPSKTVNINTMNINSTSTVRSSNDFSINNNNYNYNRNLNNETSNSQTSSDDFNNNLLTNSSYNQNLSGLTNHVTSNMESNINNSNLRANTKTKRYNTWWSSTSASSSTLSASSGSSQSLSPKDTGASGRLRQQSYQSQSASYSERQRKGAPQYRGGCFGAASRADIRRAEIFSKALKEATTLALSGQKLPDGSFERPLTTNFELLNLVPDYSTRKGKPFSQESAFDSLRSNPQETSSSSSTSSSSRGIENEPMKWRRVGLISGTNVQLDTIVWPGGDIVVSGLSSRSKTVFRVVTALAPPFVMESELDEDGLCLRGLPCHRLSPDSPHNLTLMFNAIETRDRLEEDAVEHGVKPPPIEETSSYDHTMYKTKCCYGLSMDLLDNIATELGFEFHLYIVRDEIFGSQFRNIRDFMYESEDKRPTKQYSNMKHYPTNHYSPREVFHTKERQANDNKYPSEEEQKHNSASFERKSNMNTNENDNDLNEGRIVAGLGPGPGLGPIRPSVLSYTTPTEESSTDWNKSDRRRHLTNQKNDNEEEVAATPTTNSNTNEPQSNRKKGQWNGIIGDLISGSADMSFAPLSVSRARAEAIDFSAPYFHSGVSLLAAPQSKSEIPLLAFLLPFSPELWIVIFTSLNVTAIAVAIYEWLSPFGLNPWGRQRSKNFSMSSALWVMWGLLCGHLVAFKAPKSWPNKFLINVWGGFSVIFIASYTANIAALIAGLFFHNASNRYDVSLLTQRVGAPIASAAESYVQKNDRHLWEHMKRYTLKNVEDGIRGLKNGSLDLIMGDTPILDYYRATDHGCSLQRIGDTFVEDTYAVGMTKGFPLKDSISALIAKYSSNGYLDILTEKWYGGLPCFKLDIDIVQPRPLGVEAVAGVFLLLGLGVILGVLILIFEHLFYKYTLPILRHKPKGTVWKSRNIMFFSQKLYRFINCVELVSPHHAARELVHTLRQGQIASLFQKSIKRKEDEQRRRRKSKAQFFEMIQEIRRVQQEERANPTLEVVTEVDSPQEGTPESTGQKPKSSPKPKLFSSRKDSRSRSNSSTLNVRRFSTDSILSERLDTIGRRLSRDLTNSPPDFGRRFETFGKEGSNKFDTFSGPKPQTEKGQETKFDTYSGKDSERPPLPLKKYLNRRTPLNSETFTRGEMDRKDVVRSREELKIKPLPVLKEGLVHPICQEDNTKAVLRDRLHEELKTKYGDEKRIPGRRQNPSSSSMTHKSRSADRSTQHHRQRSLDGLESRPKMPSPRRSRPDLMETFDAPALVPKVSPRSSTNLKQISLDRLSREDLLKLSESTQSEIHDYLSKTKIDRQTEPP